MPRKRYNVNLDPELHDRVVEQLGDTSFSRFTERALEAALASMPAAGTVSTARITVPLTDDGFLDLERQSVRRCELDCGRPLPTSPKATRCSCGGRLVES